MLSVKDYTLHFADKFGDAFEFKLESLDSLLPQEYFQVKNLVAYCLSKYGDKIFNAKG